MNFDLKEKEAVSKVIFWDSLFFIFILRIDFSLLSHYPEIVYQYAPALARKALRSGAALAGRAGDGKRRMAFAVKAEPRK